MFPALKQTDRRQYDDASTQNEKKNRQPNFVTELQVFACHRDSHPRKKEHENHECENEQTGGLGIIPGDDELAMNGFLIV